MRERRGQARGRRRKSDGARSRESPSHSRPHSPHSTPPPPPLLDSLLLLFLLFFFLLLLLIMQACVGDELVSGTARLSATGLACGGVAGSANQMTGTSAASTSRTKYVPAVKLSIDQPGAIWTSTGKPPRIGVNAKPANWTMPSQAMNCVRSEGPVCVLTNARAALRIEVPKPARMRPRAAPRGLPSLRARRARALEP